jgi:hypothetical protein
MLAASLTLLRPFCLAGEVESHLEYQVKAAFLFNFLKFVEWPPAAAGAPWVIGVLGHDPFGAMLDETVRGKIVNGRKIEVRRYSQASDVKDCNILFIGRGDYERIGIPVQAGMLTVGEAPGFLKAGGAINFYLEDNRVRFEIRPAAAGGAGLHVSSQLLKLGRAL